MTGFVAPALSVPSPQSNADAVSNARRAVAGESGLTDAPGPPARAPVRVGGTIRPPVKTRDVRPVYPALAQSARAQGTVIVEVTIGTDGKVIDARTLQSLPPFDDAALEAVRQWEFMPTLINGVPTPVIMSVSLQFTLP